MPVREGNRAPNAMKPQARFLMKLTSTTGHRPGIDPHIRQLTVVDPKRDAGGLLQIDLAGHHLDRPRIHPTLNQGGSVATLHCQDREAGPRPELQAVVRTVERLLVCSQSHGQLELAGNHVHQAPY